MCESIWASRFRYWLLTGEVSQSCLHSSRTRRVHTLNVRWWFCIIWVVWFGDLHRHHAVVLTELFYFLDTMLDQEFEGRHRAERVQNSEVSYVRYSIGRNKKTFNYINHVEQTLSLLVYGDMWTHSPPLVAMHLLDRSCVSVGFFLKLHATFPNSGIGARFMRRWYAWVEHKELWEVIVVLFTTNVLFDSAVLLDEAARTNLTWPHSWDRFHWQTCN